ncbi:hypothetical protein GLU60_03475 [Nanohaloarchaea archaeon H01]|nr:hypothetical protein [Nanohaloarchaea archaeon H01]
MANILGNKEEALRKAGAVKNRAKRAGTLEKSGAAAGAANAARSGAGRAREAAGNAADISENAMTTYSHLSTAKNLAEGGGESTLMEVMERLGLEGLLEGGAAEGTAGAVIGSGGTLLIALIVLFIAWLVSSIVAIAIAAAIAGFLWGYVTLVIPIVAGPVLGAFGLGEAYASYFGTEIANSEVGVAARSGNLLPPEIGRSYQQAAARLGCIAEGPQCMREWRLNNTVRPGSEARGERYELQIEQFGLGSGDSIDVAYKEANYTLPTNFLVSNTRNGLKGIPARNVSYKITVRDFDRKYCTTGWKPVSSFGPGGRDVILPGLGVSPVDSMKKLNLGNCELLQPSLGVDRVMELQVRYQYSSQATLYVDAMSRQYRREEGIEPGFKKSKTADTPVQSYINVKEPITFYETESGDRKVVPFSARFGFETPDADVRYKVKPESIQIVDSSLTNHTSTCPGIQSESRENYYKISDNAERRIELRQNNSFFNSQAEPAPLRCTMALTQDAKNRISPTGEELVMRIDGNYTVVKEDRLSGFDVRNTLCTRYNCPLVVTKEYNESSPYSLYSKCTSGNSVDARGGCAIRVPQDTDMNWRLPNVAKRNGSEIVVQQGKVARGIEGFTEDAADKTPISIEGDEGEKESAVTEDVEDKTESSDTVPFGTPTLEQITQEASSETGVIFYEDQSNVGNIQISTFDKAICKEEVRSGSVKGALRDYMAEWENNTRDGRKPLQIVVETRSCQDSVSEFIADSASCGINQYVNVVDAYLQAVNPTDSVDQNQFDESACEGVLEKAKSCTGVLVEDRDLRCYGGEFQEIETSGNGGSSSGSSGDSSGSGSSDGGSSDFRPRGGQGYP